MCFYCLICLFAIVAFVSASSSVWYFYLMSNIMNFMLLNAWFYWFLLWKTAIFISEQLFEHEFCQFEACFKLFWVDHSNIYFVTTSAPLLWWDSSWVSIECPSYLTKYLNFDYWHLQHFLSFFIMGIFQLIAITMVRTGVYCFFSYFMLYLTFTEKMLVWVDFAK